MTSKTDEQGNSSALLSFMSDRGGVVVLVGVIGGSGLYHLDNLTFVCVSETQARDWRIKATSDIDA
jgi:hypothetical protein